MTEKSGTTLPLEPITIKDWPFKPLGIAYGQGTRLQLEVLYSEHDRTPNATQLRSAWKKRQERRGVPLLVVVLHGSRASVCGPSGDDPTVYPDLDPGQVERICKEALDQPSRQAALRALRDSLGALETDGLPGLRNEGFLATHELKAGVRNRSDWNQAQKKARKALGQTGKQLLTSLGFTVEAHDKITNILRTKDHKTAIAILLNERETPEGGSDRIPGAMSPVSYALARADEENLDWVILLHGRKIRLYPVKMGVGVGRRGRTETYLECHTGLLPDEQAAYLWLLFSADALSTGGSLTSILEDSKDFAGNLAARLRERVYDEVIPRLAEGLAEARGLKNPTVEQLSETYQMAMRVLFRLLFVAYGEDKDLLPYRFNGLYQKRSLKAKAKELLELAESGGDFGEGDSWWQEVRNIFHAVDKGNPAWGVPAYNGGLFSSDPNESPIGVALEEVTLPDRVFGPALQQLLLVPTDDGVLGPVDFRSLGVREFGTIYEGLLESELSVAETDLTVETRGKNKDAYRPCREGEKPVVRKGRVYLHNASGARKSTGSYYTKHFAVEHLLGRALEPALDDHFARLDELDDLEAAEAFFDFRVADIAMGSGHFLVAAVDRIEARFSGYLSNRPLAQVTSELERLRQAAMEALGDAVGSYPDFEDNALLRRLIARRCIYGVDINEVAVQLARLAIWIHTFVPGLPLSLLDRNLVHGNSLVGVGRLSELEDKVREEGMGLFEASAADFVGDASAALARLGRLADATRTELEEARKAWKEADALTAPAKALCDILTAARIEGENIDFDFTDWQAQKKTISGSRQHKKALKVIEGMHALHFPVAFPEVFLRERSGFDVILGNPPWDKVRYEEDAFFARWIPGLIGLPQRQRKDAISSFLELHPSVLSLRDATIHKAQRLQRAFSKTSGAYLFQGSGHLDLAKLFLERISNLLCSLRGSIGIVLPRQCLVLGGWAHLRSLLFSNSQTSILQLRNRKGWIFDDAEHRYVIALLGIVRGYEEASVHILPGASSYTDFLSVKNRKPLRWTLREMISSRAPDLRIPLFTHPGDERILDKLLVHEAVGSDPQSHFYAIPFASLDVGKDLPSIGIDDSGLMVARTRSVKQFGFIDDSTAHFVSEKGYDAFLTKKLRSSSTLRELLPRSYDAPRSLIPIVYRYPSRNDDARTLIASLLPRGATPAVGYTHSCILPNAAPREILCFLGFMNSVVWDWYARRFVDRHVTAPIIRSLPLPGLTNAVIEEIASITMALLKCHETKEFPIPDDYGSVQPMHDTSNNLLIHLDALVAQSFGIEHAEMKLILSDFTEAGVSKEHRKGILDLL